MKTNQNTHKQFMQTKSPSMITRAFVYMKVMSLRKLNPKDASMFQI